MTQKAVIFDWGGVLMRTEDYTPRHCWDARLGLPQDSVEKIVHGSEVWQQAQQGAISMAAYWAAVGRLLGLDSEQAADLEADFYNGDWLDQGLVGLINSLRQRGILIGLLSNNGPNLAGQIEDMGQRSLFDAVVISAEIGIMKPLPEAYRRILAQLNVLPEQAVFIDDSLPNVAGAEAVGLYGIHFTPQLDLESALNAWLEKRP